MSNIRLKHWDHSKVHHGGPNHGRWSTARNTDCVFVMGFRAKITIFTCLKLFLVISTPAPLSSGRPESARPSFATAIKDKVGKRKKKQQRLNHDLNDTTLSTAGGGDNDFLENSKYFKKESVRISLGYI